MDSEKHLLLQAKNQSQDAFVQLQAQYEPLILKQVAKAMQKLESRLKEDCRQEALLAFHCAVMNYDLAQSEVTFGLYAKICIRNRLISFVRKQKKAELVRDEMAKHPHYTTETEDITAQLISQEEYALYLSQLRSLLSPFEQEVLLKRSAGEKPREIARSLGKSPKVVYNALSRIQAKRKGMQSQ